MTLRTIAQKDYHDLIVTEITFAVIEFLTRTKLTRDTSRYCFYSLYVVVNDEEVRCFEYYEQTPLP